MFAEVWRRWSEDSGSVLGLDRAEVGSWLTRCRIRDCPLDCKGCEEDSVALAVTKSLLGLLSESSLSEYEPGHLADRERDGEGSRLDRSFGHLVERLKDRRIDGGGGRQQWQGDPGKHGENILAVGSRGWRRPSWESESISSMGWANIG
jgi:hypothetical protein